MRRIGGATKLLMSLLHSVNSSRQTFRKSCPLRCCLLPISISFLLMGTCVSGLSPDVPVCSD